MVAARAHPGASTRHTGPSSGCPPQGPGLNRCRVASLNQARGPACLGGPPCVTGSYRVRRGLRGQQPRQQAWQAGRRGVAARVEGNAVPSRSGWPAPRVSWIVQGSAPQPWARGSTCCLGLASWPSGGLGSERLGLGLCPEVTGTALGTSEGTDMERPVCRGSAWLMGTPLTS